MIAFVIALCIILTSVSAGKSPQDFPKPNNDSIKLSSLVWSDDFENESKTLSEWTIYGWDPPNVTLRNGLLYINSTGSILTHNSSISFGTWSFDMFQYDQDSRAEVVFMSPFPMDLDTFATGNGFYSGERQNQFSYNLVYWVPDLAGAYTKTIDSIQAELPSGWSHIDITRQADRRMYVFLNETMILWGTDNEYDTSEYLHLHTHGAVVFDNISVSDTVDIDGIPPKWTEPLVNYTIAFGDDFRQQLHANDYSGLDTWWLNDSLRFHVDSIGVVSNVTSLSVGNYGIMVNVNDTFGNVLSGSFSIEVLSAGSQYPPQLNLLDIAVLGSAGIVLFIAVIVIIWFYRNAE